jgi:hypothetical protein
MPPGCDYVSTRDHASFHRLREVKIDQTIYLVHETCIQYFE